MKIRRETEQDVINIRNPHVYMNRVARMELTAKATGDVFDYCRAESFIDDQFMKLNLGVGKR